MEAHRADRRDEDDDGDDDPHHDGQKGVRLPGVLGSHPAPQMSLTVSVLECVQLVSGRHVWTQLVRTADKWPLESLEVIVLIECSQY